MFDRDLNAVKLLNMSRITNVSGSKYAMVKQGTEYSWIYNSTRSLNISTQIVK